jgi:hypothetical protein
MARRATAILVLGIALVAGSACHAQSDVGDLRNVQVVKQEPFDGMMAPGAPLLVDDGSCGKGKIKLVIGGEIAPAISRPRTRKCIARPAK